ncbi:TIGR04255 family protein [Legionella septentrionalis]|uniref:TIGR04255 family protein n=1 Tax=Legionella septentrionalis TaxID=2498109 RepID=UPI000F8DFF21|nr:TIGR04255 family protein [Legionella septentrionalis]RUR12523.1 TIGR04255 family protein [Legionella septentrionalis]
MEFQKLSKQPLKFVLAEFKFSPVLQMEKYIADLQESFRKSYPIFQTNSERTFRVFNENIETFDLKRWSFVSSDKTKAIEIDQERIIFFTSYYDRFDGFVDNCELVLNVLTDVVEPSLIQRVGLRYCDLISLDTEEKMDKLVSRNLTCPEELIELGTNRHQKNETLLKTEIGTLVIRSYYGAHNLTVPPDLINRLPIEIQGDKSKNEKMLIDFDHFWESRNDSISFDNEQVIEKLKELHAVAREAFWKLTTDYARREIWA